MAARKGCRVREECFILNKNEALYYSLTSIKTISSPYKSNWISSVKFSKEIFLLCFFDQRVYTSNGVWKITYQNLNYSTFY